MGQVVTDHVSDIIHSKSIAVDLEYYENSRYYDTLHRAQQEAPYRPMRIVNDLVSTGRALVSHGRHGRAAAHACTGASA